MGVCPARYLQSLRASAAGVVDVCLIPEVNFALDGDQGLFAYLEILLEQKGHLVICMAEGAGQVSRLPWRNSKGPCPEGESIRSLSSCVAAVAPFQCCRSTLAECGGWPDHGCTDGQGQAVVLLASAVPIVCGVTAQQHRRCPCKTDVPSHFGHWQ